MKMRAPLKMEVGGNAAHAAAATRFPALNALFNVAVIAAMIPGAPAVAQDSGEMLLDVIFLAAPTDWCPADAGVPMTVAMNGPDIIQGPEDFPRKVMVRRGGDVTMVDGENIISFKRAEDFAGQNAEVIGRFSAEFRSCVGAFGDTRANGTWTLKDLNGAIAEAGLIDDQFLSFPLSAPFFHPVTGTPEAYYAKFSDFRLFTAARPVAKTKQTFLAEPAKE
jgi:hypothetical protein